MSRRRTVPIDGFLLIIVGAAVLASFLPAAGIWVGVLDWVTKAAIAVLFFLYGARLSPAETLSGLKHWRLHTTILTFTYGAFPLLGWVSVWVAGSALGPDLSLGVLYLSVVPSTVQSSIAFTSIARGNVAGAMVSASASNIFGVFLTPLLCWVLLSGRGHVAFSFQTIAEIVLQLFVPFVVGQFTRRRTSQFIESHPRLKLVDRGTIVLVVYAAFSQGTREQMWSLVSWRSLGVLLVVCLILMAIMLTATWWGARALQFNRADSIAIQFCGTKKSLASGLPMAQVIFAGQPLGLLMLPLMVFHQAQLMACSTLATRYAARDPDESAADA